MGTGTAVWHGSAFSEVPHIVQDQWEVHGGGAIGLMGSSPEMSQQTDCANMFVIGTPVYVHFDVLLTVHLSIILVIYQLNAQILFL